jgi:DivIVA domain-containing protein
MASIIFTAKDIFDQDFKKEVRGYSKVEVNEFLDDVIKDYETYAALVKELLQFLSF